MTSRNTNWDNIEQNGQGVWLAGQSGLDAGSEFELLSGLRVYAGSLGGSTVWTNLDLL